MSIHSPGFLLPLLLPLLSGVVYVVGALLLKRASDLGADVWRTAKICNFTTAAWFAPLALLGGRIPDLPQFWQPALLALRFVLGQVFALLSLQAGDVSVATPVLGLKVIMVALLTTALIGERLTARLWAASVLSSAAIGLLHFGRMGSHQRVTATILMAVIAAAAFALFDVLVQRWSPAWGVGRLLPVMMGFVAIYSIALRPPGRTQRGTPTAPAIRWVAGGSACFALQGLMIVSSIAVYGQATVANVLYSARGLWSVLAVWMVGHWFVNREQDHGPRVLGWRLFGAALLMAAIVIVLFEARQASHTVTVRTRVLFASVPVPSKACCPLSGLSRGGYNLETERRPSSPRSTVQSPTTTRRESPVASTGLWPGISA